MKTCYTGRDKQAEQVRISAHSYDTLDQVDLIPVMGNDGRPHIVQVPWKEYVPLCSSKVMSVSTEKPDGATVHTHGLYARVIK